MASSEQHNSSRSIRSLHRPIYPFVKHFAGRIDALSSAIFIFPLFLTYQLGILTSSGHNGVDFVTSVFIKLCQSSLQNYLILLAAMFGAYVLTVLFLRRKGEFTPAAFIPMILESGLYALTMGSLILFILNYIGEFVPHLALGSGKGPLEILVISSGAGLHEELIFRAIGLGGLTWLFTGFIGARKAWIAAWLISSAVFSLAHHLGPAAEAFELSAFMYRTIAGMIFGVIYQVRGFGVAVWTHTLYDVFVLTFH